MSSIRPELKFSDNREEVSFHKAYLALPPKEGRVLRIADKGDYYIVLGDDAEFVADGIYKTSSVIKNSKSNTYKYVTLSAAVFSGLIKYSIFEMGYKLEIYDKTWSNVRLASPGNWKELEDYINSSDIQSVAVMASLKMVVAEGAKKFGVSFIDSSSRFIGLSEFVDSDLFSNLESLMIQLGVKECLLPSTAQEDPEMKKIATLLDRCDIVVTYCKSSEFNDSNVEQDMVRLTGDPLILSTPQFNGMKVSLQSLSAIISYLSLMNDESNFSMFTVERHDLTQFMKLDYSALNALNLFPLPNANNAMNKNSSLFGLLNHCKTVGGSRLLSQWLKQPLIDLQKITDRQLVVKYLIEDITLRDQLMTDFLNHVPDISKLLKKLTNSMKNSRLDDVIRLYQFVLKLPQCLEYLEGSLDNIEDERTKHLVEEEWIIPLKDYSSSLANFQELIESTIDLKSLEEATSASQLNSSSLIAINPEFDENLLKISERMEEIKAQIAQLHVETSHDINMELDKKLKLEDHHIHGYCFRLTRIDSSAIRNKSKYKELQTVKAGVFFTTNELKNLSSEISNLTEEYKSVQNKVVKEIIEVCITYTPMFLKLLVCISKLDVLTSFAHVSSYAPIPYICPTLHELNSENRVTRLTESRHPCLEVQDDLTFIANDVELVKDKKEFLIITGPNMGGKSTYIRQIGVIALMAQIGCFIPASEGDEICIFDSILARVGASDSQLKGVSTFMAEMLEMSSILKTATENSLIIVDELGRGTSTYDGFGLAWSISEFISTKIKSFTLFATHFHELTTLAEKVPTVDNLHVVAHVSGEETKDKDNITLLYKVEPGISDQSFGIHVAEVVKFPQKIINMAKRKASELEDDELEEIGTASKIHCTKEEITKGSEILKNILKSWKANIGDSLSKGEITSSEAVAELKKLVGESGEFSEQFKNDKFINEIITL